MLRWILLAYPDRLVRRRGHEATGVMVGGRGVRLRPDSVVRDDEFFVALDPRQDRRGSTLEARVRIASAVRVEWLEESFPQSLRRERSVRFDEERQRAVGITSLWYRDLLLREDRNARVEPSEASAALAVSLSARSGEFVRGDEAASNWLARLGFLRRTMPEASWPEFDDESLGAVIADACVGKRTTDEVRRSSLVPLLKGAIDARSESSNGRTGPREPARSQRQPNSPGLRIRSSTGSGRPAARAVWMDRNPTTGWRSDPGRPPSARPELPPGSGDRRSSKLLGVDVFSGPQRPSSPLPASFLARRPAHRESRIEGRPALLTDRTLTIAKVARTD